MTIHTTTSSMRRPPGDDAGNHPPFDVNALRAQFPILAREVDGKPLVYLDSAASAQRPRSVIDAMVDYETQHHANVHRGVHRLSVEATELYESARRKVAQLVRAPDARQIIFTRGATEAINLVAHSWGRANLQPGDEIVLTQMEHHSNIVPWQMVAEASGAVIRVAPITDEGALDLEAMQSLLNDRTRLVAAVHVSNTLGTINPVEQIIAMAHEVEALVLLDGAQALQHQRLDVSAMDVDFYVSSSHKMFGPTGVGFLYAKRALLDAMPPWQGGGDMIRSVAFTGTTYADVPAKFEAGTPNILGVVGLGAACDFLQSLDLESVHAHEQGLLARATNVLSDIEGVRTYGRATPKAPVISFTIDNIHPHDIGTILDAHGIAIRTGHHCTQPLMERLGVPATARASFALYNTEAEVDVLANAVRQAIEVFR